MTTYHNQFLFSEAYLAEITQIEDDSASRASMTSMSEFLIYADHDTLRQWNKSFVHECLQSLGFRTEKKSDNLALLKQHGEDDSPIGVCISVLPSANLDNTSMGNNYAFEVISALNNNGLKWGIVTNGHIWRIYHTDESTPYENYLEIDLQQILSSKDLSSFQLLFFFLKAENFVVKDGQCRFDIFKNESQDKIAYIEDELKKSLKPKDEGGQGVLSDISYGYVEYLRSKGTTNFSDDKIRETIYGGALFYMFRLLFIFYAQARELLHELELQELEFILKKIREYKDNNTARKDNFELWHSFNRIFSEINDIYNGGLFNPEENDFTKFIDDNRIADCYLAEALFNLLHYTEKNKEVKRISYRDMNVRHLGTLYEGLLEHKLFVAEEDIEIRIVKKVIEFIPQSQGGKIIIGKYIPAGQVYFGNDKGTRKASGSYYTPEYIVEYIVTNTVDEKLKELESRFDESITTYKNDLKLALNDSEKQGIGLLIKQDLVAFIENEVLNLSVLDPAMGSGHFLVNATNHISNFITRFMNGYSIDAEDTDTSTNLWRRRVVENCIHGVDLSVLATELAKLSLWILTMAKDKPLSFLNHNLKIGNSLIGIHLEDLGKYPISKKELEQNELFTKDENFSTTVAKALIEFDQIKGIVSENKLNIQEKQKHLKALNDLLEPFKRLCDFHLSLFFGDVITKEIYSEIISRKIPTPQASYNFGFHWQLEFPELLLKQEGFDCIIGNPPWGSDIMDNEYEKAFCSLQYKTLEGKFDFYKIFIDKGLSLLSKGGRISYITPNTWFTNKQAYLLRKEILSKYHVDLITIWGKSAFQDVTADSVSFCITKNKLSNNEIVVHFFEKNYKLIALQEFWLLDEYHNITVFSDKEIQIILTRIKDNSYKLGDITEMCQGVVPYSKSSFETKYDRETSINMVNNRIFHSINRLSNEYEPEITGKNVRRYFLDLSEFEWIKYGPWLHRPRDIKFFESDRIAVRRIFGNKVFIATFIDSRIIQTSLLHSIITTSDNEPIKYLLAIINSKLLGFNFTYSTSKIDITFPEVRIFELQEIPLKRISYKTKILLEELVDMILLKKSIEQYTDVESILNLVDYIIYDLYIITGSDVNIPKMLFDIKVNNISLNDVSLDNDFIKWHSEIVNNPLVARIEREY